MKIAVLPGDGIGPEIMTQALRVLDVLKNEGMAFEFIEAPLGGQAYDQYGHPYPEFTQNICRDADAVLLGAVGGPQYDNLDRPLRPERGLLAIRKDLGLFDAHKSRLAGYAIEYIEQRDKQFKDFDLRAFFCFIWDKDITKVVEISYCFILGAFYDTCPGYWDRNLVWYPLEVNPQYFMIEDFIKEIKNS